MTAALNKLSDDVRAKRIEAESNEQIEMAKIASSDRQAAIRAQVDLVKVEAQLSSTENVALLKLQVSDLERQIAYMASGAAAQPAEPPEPGEGMEGSGMPPVGAMGGMAAVPPAAPQQQPQF